jgi:hypothetical protein
MQKEFYEAPTTDVLDVKLEGVICQSGGGQKEKSIHYAGLIGLRKDTHLPPIHQNAILCILCVLAA